MRFDSFYFLCRDVSFSSDVPFYAERCLFKSKTCYITYFYQPHLVSRLVLVLYYTVQCHDSERQTHLKMEEVFKPNSSLNRGCMQVSRLCHVVVMLHIFNTDLESYCIYSSWAKTQSQGPMRLVFIPWYTPWFQMICSLIALILYCSKTSLILPCRYISLEKYRWINMLSFWSNKSPGSVPENALHHFLF